MSNTRIHRYIMSEIMVPALLSLLIFTFVLLMGRIPKLTELVISKGVPLSEIAQLFSYLLPTFLRVTVPLSFLLGILLAFGRLSADSEYIALKASGVSLYSLLKPVLIIAACCSLLTGYLTISLEPAAKSAFRGKLLQIASGRASVGIQPGVFNDEFDGLVLYTREMDDRQGIMQGVFISDERKNEPPATIVARTGRFIPNHENFSLTLRLGNGTIHRKPPGDKKATYQIISFNTYDINLDIGQQLGTQKRNRKSRGELSWDELKAEYYGEGKHKGQLKYLTEIHMRLAIAFAPLVMAAVGIPLGLQSNRSGKGSGFSMALVISLIYYLLFSIVIPLSNNGVLPPAPALWLPNACFLLGGIYFLHRTAAEKPLVIFAWLNAGKKQIIKLFSPKGKRS